MKNIISIFVILFFYNNCFSQHSIELKNGTVITNIRINAINNNTVEYEQNKSLHDEFIENIYKISLANADTIILFDTLKKPIYMARKPKVLDTTKTVIINKTDTIVDYVNDLKKQNTNQKKDAITFNISNLLNRFPSPLLIGYEKSINKNVSVLIEGGPTFGEFFNSAYSEISGINLRNEFIIFEKNKTKTNEVKYHSIQLVAANNLYTSNWSAGIHGKKGIRNQFDNGYVDSYIGFGLRFHTFNRGLSTAMLLPSFTIGFRLGFHTNK